MIDGLPRLFAQQGATITTPDVVQALGVEKLNTLIPQHDGWIIDNDPATRKVFEAGKAGQLKAQQ